MLRPGEQRLLVDAVRAPAGYRLDHALFTTYSLDLAALLSIPLALTFSDWDEEGGRPRVDPVALLEAIRRNAARLTVLCQAGEIALPASRRNLFAFLEPAIREVSAPRGGAFHPKLTVLRYEPIADPEAPVRYRVLCSSRNVTFDRSWDLMLVLDGQRGRRPRGEAQTRPLARFVREVTALARSGADPLDDDRSGRLEALAGEIERVVFESPQDLKVKHFHPLGLPGPSTDPLEGRRDRPLVISPFLGQGFLKRIASPGAKLVSSGPELDHISEDVRELFDEIYVLSESALPEAHLEEDTGDAAEDESSREATDENGRDRADANHSGGRERLADSAAGYLRGLHAKLYAASAGHGSRLWVGSANATSAAFSKNVEFLVELEGRYGSKPESLLGDDEGGLVQILRRYVPSEVSQADRDEREAEFLADAAGHAIAAAGAELHISEAREDDKFIESLVFPDGLPQEAEGLERLEAWPTTLHQDRRIELLPSRTAEPAWEGMAAAQLTAFLALRVVARVGEATVQRDLSIRTRLVGEPENRDAEIMHSVLGSAEQLLRYLAFLLADPDRDIGAAPELIDLLTASSADPDAPAPLDAAFPLFESLVRAIERDPERIERVARLIEDLSRTERGRELIPDGFAQIWEPIRQAHESIVGRS